MSNLDNGFIDHWLRNIRDVFRLHKGELDAIEKEEDRSRRLVELNVLEQCINVYKTSVFQQTRQANARDPAVMDALPRIHPLVFDQSTGYLKKLSVDWKTIAPALRDVYNLDDQPKS